LVWDLATKDEISLICKAKKTGILALGRDYAAYSASYGSSCQISVSGSKGRPYCTATFATDKSNGGATPAPTPTTYKVGDTYVKDGVALGTVVSVDSTGQHGQVVVARGNADGLANAAPICNSLTAGGLLWGVADGRDTCRFAETGEYYVSDHTGYVSCSYGGVFSYSSSTGIRGVVCSAPF